MYRLSLFSLEKSESVQGLSYEISDILSRAGMIESTLYFSVVHYARLIHVSCWGSCGNVTVSAVSHGEVIKVSCRLERCNKPQLSARLQVLLEILSGLPPADENQEPQFLVSCVKEAFTVFLLSHSLQLQVITCFLFNNGMLSANRQHRTASTAARYAAL